MHAPSGEAARGKGMQWIENARLFKETIIGTDGKSANMTTIHPLEYAIGLDKEKTETI